MADPQVKIVITGESGQAVQAAKQAEAQLKTLGETAKSTVAPGMDRVKEASSGAAGAFGRVLAGARSLVNVLPGLGLAGLVGLVVAGLRQLASAAEESAQKIGLSRTELQGLKNATEDIAAAKAKFNKAVADGLNPQRTATERLERENALINEQLHSILELAAARMKLEKAQIEAARGRGEISDGEAEYRLMALDVAYGEFSTEKQISANEALLENRRRALAEARSDMESKQEAALKAREAAGQAQADLANKALQAERASKPDESEGAATGWGSWAINWIGGPVRAAIQSAQRKQADLTKAGLLRAQERARRLEEEAREAEARAKESIGRYGGLVNSGEEEKLRIRNQTLRGTQAMEEQARRTEYEGEIAVKLRKALEDQARLLEEQNRAAGNLVFGTEEALRRWREVNRRLEEVERRIRQLRAPLPGQ